MDKWRKKGKKSVIFQNYIRKIAKAEVGKGTEGKIWLTRDNDTVKYTIPRFRKPYSTYMITEEDMKLESFLFPTELFIVDDTVAGYRAPYFKGDIFNRMDEKAGKVINLENLANARETMIRDVEALTKAKYKIEDIENNLMFDGKKLKAIDTLEYHKVKNIEVYEYIVANLVLPVWYNVVLAVVIANVEP